MPTRREFLASSAALAALACARPPRRTAVPADDALAPDPADGYEVIVREGVVHDGGGGEPIEADVGIAGGRIVAVGPRLQASRSTRELDARGLAVAPGFVDIHSHADGSMFLDPRMESVVRQGITTVVVGQDGFSRFPATAPTAADGDDGPRYVRLRDLFAAVDALRPAANVASMVGLGAVRALVVGEADRPATADELARMTAHVRDALADGACGASSGLEYNPGAFATRDELTALCRPLAGTGLPYATHMRNEDDRVVEALEEAIAIARGAGCALEVSHLKADGRRNWAKADTLLAMLERARADGVAAGFDVYPYAAYATGLDLLFPLWTQDGGTDAFLARLADPAQRDRIRAGVLEKVEGVLGGWNNVMIGEVAHAPDKGAEGQRLGDWAAARGEDPYEAAAGLIARSRNDVGMVGFSMSEENAARFIAHPLGVVCSDGGAFAVEGPARRGHPHPRGLGAFPRVLAHYVRERRVLSVAAAVRKMSALPAERVGLRDRGRLAPGYTADVVAFDPAAVADRATFAAPFQYAAGIRHVLVNGRPALRDGERVDERAGRSVRGG
jgi:N-acyl-D-amino-acid deacylase